ncbi:uncharacterized protein [Macrobrachium rosenbergii]|uniref:uncharacterized protein n=1 Tax=Macrobrachium rosenbergii TaxID=79674 RepID=UPI0034D5DEF1
MQGDKVEVAEFDVLRRRRNITAGEKTSDSNFRELDQEPCQETSDDKDVNVYNGDVENARVNILREERKELDQEDCQEMSDGEDPEEIYDSTSWETQDSSDDDVGIVDDSFFEEINRERILEPSDDEDIENVYEPFGVCCSPLHHSLKTWKSPHEFPGKTGPKVIKCNKNDDEDLHMYVHGLDKNSPSYAKRKLSSFLAEGSAKELADIEMAGERVADISVKRRTNITEGEKPCESNSNLRRDGTVGCTQQPSNNKDNCKNYLKLLPDENVNKVCGDSFSSIPGSSKTCMMRHQLTLTKKTGPKVKCNKNDDEDLHMHVRDLDKNSLSCAKRKLSSFLAKDSAKELAEMEMADERVADISVKRRRTNITDGEKPHESNSNLRRDGTEGCTQECSDNKDDCKNYLKLLPDENMNKACGDSFLSIPGSSKICEMRHPLTKKIIRVFADAGGSENGNAPNVFFLKSYAYFAAHKAINFNMSDDDILVDKPSMKAAQKAINFNMSDEEDLCVDEPSVKAAHKEINFNMCDEGHLCVYEPCCSQNINQKLNMSDEEDSVWMNHQ